MTIFGIHVNDCERAWAWSDSEIYKADLPIGDASKVAINALACIVGVAAGHLSFIERIGREIISASSIDHLAAFLGDKLTDKKIETGCCAAVGWSHRFGRIVGYSFRSFERFAATLTRSVSNPIEDVSCDPLDADDIVAIASAQIRTLQKSIPLATGRVLTIAEVGPGSISARPYYDFESGKRLQKPPIPRAQLVRAS